MIVLGLGVWATAGVIAFLSSRNAVEVAADPDQPARMASWWNAAEGEGLVLTFALFVLIGAAICGASVAGAEWRAGTITTVLTWAPTRWRLHAARTASAGVLAFCIGFLLLAAAMLMLMPAVLVNGSTEGTDSAWWTALLWLMLRISVAAAMVAVLALNIATLGRNTSAALVVMAGWALVVERVIAALRPGWARFMISENVATVGTWRAIKGVEFHRGPLLALVTLAAYLGVVVAAATVSFVRRDVAAGS